MTAISDPCFLLFSVASALAAHRLIRKYFVATLCASGAACLAFQIAAYVHIGYVDPFALVVFVVQFPFALAIAASVGGLFALSRWVRARSSS